jgi:DNA polymerase I-like protein with 3'-5' exonuclease and polymerase domains
MGCFLRAGSRIRGQATFEMIKPTKVCSAYEHALQAVYHKIDYRGILVDTAALSVIRDEFIQDIQSRCDYISQKWNTPTYVGKITPKIKDGINLNASGQLITGLKKQGYKVPRSRKTQEESAELLSLLKIYATTNDECINKIIEINKIKTVLTRYINARLYRDSYFCSYNVCGTVTGRRGSSKHIFGYGNNAQNWPKYSDLGKRFRKCLIARPGKIFYSVDQMQAEDWIVVALSNNLNALEQMLNRVDRHKKTAAFLFGLPEDQIKKYPERFLGKKTRHANNYGMWINTFSETLAKEGFAFSPDQCKYLLQKMDEYDPSIKLVFHKYVQDTLSSDRMLVTPFGRERIFFGLHPRRDNTRIFMEAYSYIPQSTVADNTGFAIIALDSVFEPIVHECHDSITLEIDDNEESILRARTHFIEAFDRTITLSNTGITVQIPLEFELGYNLKDTIAGEDMSEDSHMKAWEKLRNVSQNSGAVMA